jgi:hypothetical protein
MFKQYPWSLQLCGKQGCGHLTQWLGSYSRAKKPLYSAYCRKHYMTSRTANPMTKPMPNATTDSHTNASV